MSARPIACARTDRSFGRASCSIRSSTRAASMSASQTVTRDITERKKAEEQLEEARTALVQSQKLQALGELTGGIAHDFNNLMTVVAGSADFLLRKPDLPEAKRKQYLEAIAETADRATTLTNHLSCFWAAAADQAGGAGPQHTPGRPWPSMSRTLGSSVEVELDLAQSACRVEIDSSAARNGHPQRRGQCARCNAGWRYAHLVDAAGGRKMARSSLRFPSVTRARACRRR